MFRGIYRTVRQLEPKSIRHVLRLQHFHAGLFRIRLDGFDKCLRYAFRILYSAVLLFDFRHELFSEATHRNFLAVPGIAEVHDVAHREIGTVFFRIYIIEHFPCLIF